MNEKLRIKEEVFLNNYLPTLDQEYIDIVKEILDNQEFKKRLSFLHHEDSSVYVHCLLVSYKAYKISKALKLDYKSAAIAGLLHDFYNEDWHTSTHKEKNFFDKHGFRHPKEALKNSRIFFQNFMNPMIEDAIVKHMFPLTISLPRYKESWIITLSDKLVSLSVFKKPTKILTYVGIGLKKGDKNE